MDQLLTGQGNEAVLVEGRRPAIFGPDQYSDLLEQPTSADDLAELRRALLGPEGESAYQASASIDTIICWHGLRCALVADEPPITAARQLVVRVVA